MTDAIRETPDYDDDDRDECFWCGGEGWEECDDSFQCLYPHIGNSHRCPSCGGSGLKKDMTLW